MTTISEQYELLDPKLKDFLDTLDRSWKELLIVSAENTFLDCFLDWINIKISKSRFYISKWEITYLLWDTKFLLDSYISIIWTLKLIIKNENKTK
jgi:hypothetical protein